MSVAKRKQSRPEPPSEPHEESEPSSRPSPTRPDEMTGEVVEFIQAIDKYKRLQQRPFPSWSEVLEVLKSLGYSKAS